MGTRKLLIVLVALSVVTVTGVATYTSASVERSVSVSVAADDSGVVQLNPGEGAEISNDELVINADNEALNVNANFMYGSNSTPTSTYAFSITNADDSTHQFNLTHNGPASVEYHVYDGTGTSKTITNGETKSFGSVASGDTLYVVMEFNTPSTPQTQSGTFTISAD